MTAYLLRVVPTEHDPRVLPRADIYTRCTRAGCDREYLMAPPRMRLREYPPSWLDEHRPRYDDIAEHAARDGWTRTDDGPRCPDHPAGKPIGELESHEAAQVSTDTAEIDVDAVKAALEDEGEDDE